MERLLKFLILLFVLGTFNFVQSARATTWDEPWHGDVMRNSDSFVKVKITGNTGPR